MNATPKVLVVDDIEQNIRLLDAVLSSHGYEVLTATSGRRGLELLREHRPDVVLLDVLMPEMDGYEVCRRIRADDEVAMLSVVMVTASEGEEKLRALEAGADDFIQKPFNHAELLARVKSLVRIQQYRATIERQAVELAEWNQKLQERVDEQVSDLSRLGRLRRFLSPQVAELLVKSSDDNALASHRKEIAVLFCDLRGFTSFSEVEEPEEVMAVLGQFHEAIGQLVHEHEATVGFFQGDGLMVFFNDPTPCDAPASKAVALGLAMRQRALELAASWRERGHILGLGVGISLGYATLGEVGFEGRRDYSVIGSIVNLASRLCDEAAAGQILVTQRVKAAVDDVVRTEAVEEFHLKGFTRPVPAFSVVGPKRSTQAAAEAYPDGLSEREVEVLRLLAAGLSNQRIADELVISFNTVARHVSNILDKTGSTNRAEAASYAHLKGLV